LLHFARNQYLFTYNQENCQRNESKSKFVRSSTQDLKIDQNLKRNNVKRDFVNNNKRDLKIDEILNLPQN